MKKSKSICDIHGIRVGHYTDTLGITGCTVILFKNHVVCGVDIRGSAPGTRETALLDPLARADKIHGLLLTGGSAFGLAAADGVMKYLEENNIGVIFRGSVIPIVPAAVIFDLEIGNSSARPDIKAGYEASIMAGDELKEGSVGAGTGATVGKVLGMKFCSKGGIGSWCTELQGGIKIGALAVVNSFGDVYAEDGTVLSGCKKYEDGKRILAKDLLLEGGRGTILDESSNTTLGVIATNAVLNKCEITKVAQMAQAGLIRSIIPSHSTMDGDCLFGVATGDCSLKYDLTILGQAAAITLASAIRRAVLAATPLGGIDVG